MSCFKNLVEGIFRLGPFFFVQERLQRLYWRFRQAKVDAQAAAAELTRSLVQPVPLDESPMASVREALAAVTVTTQEMLTARSVISHALGSAGHP